MKKYILLFKKNNLSTKYTHETLVQAYRNNTDKSIKSYVLEMTEINVNPKLLGFPEANATLKVEPDSNEDELAVEGLKKIAHDDGVQPDNRSIWCIFSLRKIGPGASPDVTQMSREMLEISV